MTNTQVTRAGWLAVGLALFGSLVALVNECVHYRRSGTLDWGHLALVVGVPALMFAIVKSANSRRP